MPVIVVAGTPAPLCYAPALLSPANGTYQDCSGTPTFSWQYNPGQQGLTQTGYQFVRITNGGSTFYWNASTQQWQSGAVWNTASGSSITFPSGSWADGNTYQWAVATEDANGQGPLSGYFTVIAQAVPTVTVTSPLSGGVIPAADPYISWTVQFPGSATQISYRVVIYDSAQYAAGGFTPGSGPSIYDTGVVGSTTVTALDLSQIPVYLAVNTTFRAYVQVTETGNQSSNWAYSQFSTSYTAPYAPVVTAATGTDPDTDCPLIAVTVDAHLNYLPLDDANPILGIGTWTAASNCTVASTAQGLQVKSSAAGNMSAQTAALANTPIVAGDTYTVVAQFQAATTAEYCTVGIQWLNSSGGVILTTTSPAWEDNTSDSTEINVNGAAPSGAVSARVIVTVESTEGSGEVHYVTYVGIFAGTYTGWAPGGFLGVAQVVILRSDGLYVRNASLANPGLFPTSPASDTVTIDDYEAVPTVTYTYSAFLVTPNSTPNSAVVSNSATSGDVTLTTTEWWEFDPTNPSTAVAAQAIDWEPQVTEQSTAHLVTGLSTPFIVANMMGGLDGQATFETFDPNTYASFQALLLSQKTIFVSSPWGPTDTAYVRFGPQTGGLSSGTGNKAQDSTLQPSTYAAMHRTTAVTWVAQPRPAV